MQSTPGPRFRRADYCRIVPSERSPILIATKRSNVCSLAALALPPAGGLKGHKYRCLLGLLSVSGLRVSEALNLKLDDVDLHEGVLTIWKTKFGKSRWCPFTRQRGMFSLIYLHRRSRFIAGRAACHVFVSGTGNRLDLSDVHRTFYALSRQIGLRGPTASHGPRLHDLRHNSGNRIIPATDGQPLYFVENHGVAGT